MDTIKKLSDYAIITGQPTRFIGCPKTIDNDFGRYDTPGFGSAAKDIGNILSRKLFVIVFVWNIIKVL